MYLNPARHLYSRLSSKQSVLCSGPSAARATWSVPSPTSCASLESSVWTRGRSLPWDGVAKALTDARASTRRLNCNHCNVNILKVFNVKLFNVTI